MSLKGVNISKGTIGANASGRDSSISGIIANGIAVAGKLVLGTVYKITGLADADAIGINAAYDSTNSVNVYRHVSEFFRMAGEGTSLYVMVVAKTILPDAILEDTTAIYAKKMIVESGGTIRQIAVAFNPNFPTYTETALNGMNSDIAAAIPKGQLLADWAYASFRPVQILLEGRNHTGNAGASQDLRAIDNSGQPLQATQVSVVNGQDYAYADALGWAEGKKMADVGTALGILSFIDPNENIGEVQRLNLSDAVNSKWLKAGFSNHTTIESREAEWETFDAKGYIFPITYTGISGYRFNDDHVCAPKVIDGTGKMNEHYISLGRVVSECARSLRTVLLPEVKKVHPVDPDTGKLPPGLVKYFEGIGDDVFADYQANGIITFGKTTVDPNSNLLTGSKSLDVSFIVMPTGTVGVINGKINLKTSL